MQNINKTIEIPSNIEYIRKTSEEILGVLQRLEINKSIQFDVRLAVEEAVRNAIVHGHRDNKGEPITVSYTADEDKIEIEVEDKGRGFDLDKVPDPTIGENLLKGNGRGILLIHKFMDKVKYNKIGNKVKMIKFFK